MKQILKQDGIAIGAILFVVAIIAVIAIAISAGSGTFGGNSDSEKSRSYAAELIHMGISYKAIVERTQGLGPYTPVPATGLLNANTDPRALVYYDNNGFSPNTGSNGIYSVTGGGGVAPSPALSPDPSQAFLVANQPFWIVPMTSVGTPLADVVFLYVVSKNVCDAARALLRQTWTMNTVTLATSSSEYFNPATTANPLADNGQFQGCVQENANYNKYVFYQVIASR